MNVGGNCVNNLLKKCTGIFTAAILTAGITPVNINAADLLNQDNTAVWDGTADISWYNDEDTVFYISSSQELAGFAQLVNEGNSFKDKTVTLKNNITLNAEDLDGWNETESTVQLWTPIGSDEEKYFAGTFDGAFFSIYGLSVNKIDNAGLFGYAKGASIKNLGAEALFVIEGEQNAGGICGYAVDTEFSECVNYAVIKSSATAGGIAGFAKDCNFESCFNSGHILVQSQDKKVNSGGIAGIAEGSFINDCGSYSSIIGCRSNGENVYSGGICGSGAVKITNCSNSCNVVAFPARSEKAYIGGIIGIGSSAMYDVQIENCSNFGTCGGFCYQELLTESSETEVQEASEVYAGGICGYGADIYNCYNIHAVGGGVYKKNTEENEEFVFEGNSTEETEKYEEINMNVCAGGIGGCNVNITNCYNVGSVQIDEGIEATVGGLIGRNEETKIIDNSYYLELTADTAVGEGYSEDMSAMIKTASDISSPEFAELMGNEFKYVFGRSPQLSTVRFTETLVVPGDANGDGYTDISDAAAMKLYLLNSQQYPLNVYEKKNADIHGSNGINAQDVVTLQKHLLGIPVKMTCQGTTFSRSSSSGSNNIYKCAVAKITDID